MTIGITPLAQEKLTSILNENKVALKVRVYLPDCDCSGAGGQLSLAMDQPAENDLTDKAGDLELFMGRDLFDTVGSVTIDFKEDGRDSGFVVESQKPLPSISSDCGGGCSCCG
ncbi:MAG: IscA/HesB family protein [Candidatus Adiutrix sp.]|jgi:Fe-S cluster assembly iron-binding protein IscA|nr:IscA/HesB family protein [Candidatus Adiutrix sp.]